MSAIFDHQLDAFESLDYSFAGCQEAPTERICKFCGAEGLHWHCRNGVWHLYTADGVKHICKILNKGGE